MQSTTTTTTTTGVQLLLRILLLEDGLRGTSNGSRCQTLLSLLVSDFVQVNALQYTLHLPHYTQIR
jgi:hypothetical protein